MAMEPQRASPMSKMVENRLPSSSWLFWIGISFSCTVKMMVKNVAPKSNLALKARIIKYFCKF